jgi:hypothetical protein
MWKGFGRRINPRAAGAPTKKHLQNQFTGALLKVVIPSGLEPETCCLEGSCSIQLSYETWLYWCFSVKASQKYTFLSKTIG